jgi:hypothetical protein
MSEIPETARLKWNQLREAFENYITIRMEFHKEAVVYTVDLVREALEGPPRGLNQELAFEIADHLSEEERFQLLPQVLRFCCIDRSAQWARTFVLNLPRQRVLESIERLVEPLLAEQDYFYWLAIADLFHCLDRPLALKMAVRMASHEDYDIREWGEELLKDFRPLEENGEET